MKRPIGKSLALGLVLVWLLTFWAPVVKGEGAPLVRLYTYSDGDGEHRITTLMQYQGELYVTAADAITLSGYDAYSEDDGRVEFQYGRHRVTFREGQIDRAGVFYYPLQKLMDALSTAYHYDDVSGTLVFVTCSSYFENLLADCKAVFDEGYELTFLEGTGWQVAGVYEIVAGLRVDAFWGGYQRELYEDTLAGMLTAEESSLVKTMEQGDAILSKLATLLAFTRKDIDGLETGLDFLGTDLDGVIDAYSQLKELSPGIGAKEAVEILNYVSPAVKAAEAIPNAIRYGLVENPYVEDENLTAAAAGAYMTYDENKASYEKVLLSLVENVAKEKAEEALEETAEGIAEKLTLKAIHNLLGTDYRNVFINDVYIQLTKLILDELGMKERSTAVMQTIAARNIQIAAELQFELNCGETAYRITGNRVLKAAEEADALRTKYSTLLYLRACQYAYSLYEFDPQLAPWCKTWKEKTADAMGTISAYSDGELTGRVSNQALSMDDVEPLEEGEYGFVPSVMVLSDWPESLVDGQPTIAFERSGICQMTFNMAEGMWYGSGKFTVLGNESGERVIQIDLDQTGFGETLYLLESDRGSWTYMGQGIGMTAPGAIYKARDELLLPIACETMVVDTEGMVGEYSLVDGDPLDVLLVRHLENGEVTFDVEWFRTAGMDGVTGKAYGNLVPFQYAYYDHILDESFYKTTGILKWEGEQVYLMLFATQLPYVEVGTYVYQRLDRQTSADTLPDGEYRAEIYRNGSTLLEGVKHETIGVVEYVELSNEQVLRMEVGQRVELPGIGFTIASLERYEEAEYREILFNGGEYRCVYREETDRWRFAWPSDLPVTYVSGTYLLPAEEAVLVDLRTPLGTGQNLYGVTYHGETDREAAVFRLNSLADYLDRYALESETATVTVRDGAIVRVEISYRP